MTAALAPSTIVENRYEILERLDDRGYGESFRARDTRLRARFVMLKFLRPVPRGEITEALVDHAQLLRQFKHPGVLATVGHGVHEGRPFLVHELFEGKSLGTGLDEARSSGNLLPARLLEGLFARIAAAVAAGHTQAQPVFHGCLNPGCVVIQHQPGKEFEVRLFDFGVTRFADPDPAAPARSARALMYLAPEQIREPDAPPTPAMDIFGLGALLREMLSLPPDLGATMAPTTVQRRRDDCPIELWNAAGVAMNASPAERFPTIEAFLDVVQRAWAQSPAKPTDTPPRPAPSPAATPVGFTAGVLPPLAAIPVVSAAPLVEPPQQPPAPSPALRRITDYAATFALDEEASPANPWSVAPVFVAPTPAPGAGVTSMDDLMRAVQSAAERHAQASAMSPPPLDSTNRLDEGGAFVRQPRGVVATTEGGTLILEDDGASMDLSATSIDPPEPAASPNLAMGSGEDTDFARTTVFSEEPGAPPAAAKPTVAPTPAFDGTMVLDGMGGTPTSVSNPRPAMPLAPLPAPAMPLAPPPAPAMYLAPPPAPAMPRTPLPAPQASPAVYPPSMATSAYPAQRTPPAPPGISYQTKLAILIFAILTGLALALVVVKVLFDTSRSTP